MYELEKYLVSLLDVPDVRPINEKLFRMKDIQNGETPFDCLEKIFEWINICIIKYSDY